MVGEQCQLGLKVVVAERCPLVVEQFQVVELGMEGRCPCPQDRWGRRPCLRALVCRSPLGEVGGRCLVVGPCSALDREERLGMACRFLVVLVEGRRLVPVEDRLLAWELRSSGALGRKERRRRGQRGRRRR